MSLVRAALAGTDWVIVTLFVNPRQFNSADDLTTYPRTENEDLAKSETTGAHVLYAPNLEDMYPPGFATTVQVGGVSQGLCGSHREGHFDAVATIVTKLFLQTGADIVYLGEKDFQQLHVVRRLAHDLDIPIEVVACPTIRDADGMAMSSRNTRLSAEERKIASHLPTILFETAKKLSGGLEPREAIAEAQQRLRTAGFAGVDYLELRSEAELSSLDRLDRPARLLAAATVGGRALSTT
nr:pantoate--beta-alanine ligase [Sinorhizobium sp. 8-89]